MRLCEMKSGDRVRIKFIHNQRFRGKGLRLGLCEGAVLTCGAVLAGGPVVVFLGAQEIAIGRAMADEIEVEYI